MKGSKKYLVFGVLIAFVLAGCSGSSGDPSPGDDGKSNRKEVLTHMADNIIIPSYELFRTKFDVLKTKSTGFTTAPSVSTLTELRSAWVDAYKQWQHVELFAFGPADEVMLRSFMNIYPADVTGINASIDDPTISLETSTAYARQGFPALDFLINGTGETDEAIVAYFNAEEKSTARKTYLNLLITRMDTRLATVESDWTSYRDAFVSNTGVSAGSSFANIINAFSLEYERFIRTGKVGIPSGALTSAGEITFPEKVEAYYKQDISRTLAHEAHEAAFDFFTGKDALTGTSGPSFVSYLDLLEAKDTSTGTLLSTIIKDQFVVVSTEISGVNENFSQVVTTNNTAMLDLHTEMQKLVRMLKVDFPSAVSVVITYTDNDGD